MLFYMHGGLLIEMEDNVNCDKTMIGYFLSLFFYFTPNFFRSPIKDSSIPLPK